jgi:hypothetical protein
MTSEDLLNQAADLVDSVVSLAAGQDFLSNNLWSATLIVGLVQGNDRLDSIKLLVAKYDYFSAEILTRSLFELAVNLAYIAKDVDERLPKYLRHGGVPTTDEEAAELKII